jgi:multidrug resistance efflux pump
VIRAKISEAKLMLESFKLKSQLAGTVERLAAVPGMTFGPTSHAPLMYLVPSGKRVVRAEVEAEFVNAHKIDAQKGQTVTICDHHDTTQSYTGTVLRIGQAFLPKRFGDTLLGSTNRVLECTIEIVETNQSGKPPLRPGQAVRVMFSK